MPYQTKKEIDDAIIRNIQNEDTSHRLSDIIRDDMIKDASTRKTLLSVHGFISQIMEQDKSIRSPEYDTLQANLSYFGNLASETGMAGQVRNLRAMAGAIGDYATGALSQKLTDTFSQFQQLLSDVAGSDKIDGNLKKQLYAGIYLAIQKQGSKASEKDQILVAELTRQINNNFNALEQKPTAEVEGEVKQSQSLEAERREMESKEEKQDEPAWTLDPISFELNPEIKPISDVLSKLYRKRNEILNDHRTRNVLTFGHFKSSEEKKAEVRTELQSIKNAKDYILDHPNVGPSESNLRPLLLDVSNTLKKHGGLHDAKNVNKFNRLIAFLKPEPHP